MYLYNFYINFIKYLYILWYMIQYKNIKNRFTGHFFFFWIKDFIKKETSYNTTRDAFAKIMLTKHSGLNTRSKVRRKNWLKDQLDSTWAAWLAYLCSQLKITWSKSLITFLPNSTKFKSLHRTKSNHSL